MKTAFGNRLFIILAVEHYNTLGLIRSLGEMGIYPFYIAIKGKVPVASSSKYIDQCVFVENSEEGYNFLLKRFGDEYRNNGAPFVFCIDDRTVSYMDTHYDELKDKFVFFNAGARGRINEYMDKLNILSIAKRHGLKVLNAVRCKKGEIPSSINYPVITKAISPVIGGWKSDVFICRTADDLRSAYKIIKADTVLVQEYIDKKNEYAIEGFSINHGKECAMTISATYNYLIPGYYSPLMTIDNMNKQDLKTALEGIIAEIGFEGIFEIEFLIDQDGSFYFGEINFRNSTWNYASTIAGMNIPYLWAKGMNDGYIIKDSIKKIDNPFMAMVEPIDYGKRIKTGNAEFGEWLKDFKEAKCLFYYNKEDMEPFFVMCRNWDKLS